MTDPNDYIYDWSDQSNPYDMEEDQYTDREEYSDFEELQDEEKRYDDKCKQ